MSKFKKWIDDSHRTLHFHCGILLGFSISSQIIPTLLWLSVVASSLEYKDKKYGDGWDWIDWGLTLAGGIIGLALRIILDVYFLKRPIVIW